MMTNDEYLISLLEANNVLLERIYACLLVCIGVAAALFVLLILWTAIKKII